MASHSTLLLQAGETQQIEVNMELNVIITAVYGTLMCVNYIALILILIGAFSQGNKNG